MVSLHSSLLAGFWFRKLEGDRCGFRSQQLATYVFPQKATNHENIIFLGANTNDI
jgi:hypothetical protein